MLTRVTILLFLIALFLGCGVGKEKKEVDKEFKTFEKKREIDEVGFDLDLLRRSLNYYPEFKKSISDNIFDMEKMRGVSAQSNIDTPELITMCMLIKEIEDSSKTSTGQEFLKKKYNSKVLDIVEYSLGLKI